MYICRHCGQVSQNDNINYCTNIKCRYYGYNYGMNNNNLKNNMTNNMSNSMPNMMNNMANNMAMPNMMNNMQNSTNMPSMQNMTGNMTAVCNERVMSDNSCGMLGFATVPMQRYEKMMPLDESLRAGTIYSSLNMPYDKRIIWRG